MELEKRLTKKVWTVFIIYGLIGQLAWTIENMYLNIYIYRTVTYDPNAIAWMVALSGIVATITSLVMGVLSDKLGKRKIFISVGYILWGLSIIGFAFINKENVGKLFPNSNIIFVTVFLIIFLDCIMTFFGSTANDAAFNVWVTDVTHETNRGKVEGVLSAMPLFSMLIIFGLFDGFTQQGKWLEFYLIIGAIVLVSGVLGLFLIKDEHHSTLSQSTFKGLFYGFKKTTIVENKHLYITFIAIMLLGIAQQVYMPYFIIYFEYYLDIKDYAIVLGSILILASIISIIGGKYIDKTHKGKLLIGLAGIQTLTLLLIFVSGLLLKDNKVIIMVLSIVIGTFMMGSYLLLMAGFNTMIRNLVPKNRIGLFNGVRMIFFVTIPMIIGPFIGSTIIRQSKGTFFDEFGVLQYIPNPGIFLGASIVSLLIFFPIYYLNKTGGKEHAN